MDSYYLGAGVGTMLGMLAVGFMVATTADEFGIVKSLGYSMTAMVSAGGVILLNGLFTKNE